MFDVKETISQSNRVLYVVATINKDAILAAWPQMSGGATPASTVVSIEDIIKNVNPTDKKLLTIIPEQFLSNDQLAGKRQGLKEEGEYIRNKAERKNRTNNYYVKMTRDRIDNAIKQYGVKWSDSYSEAYMAYINPQTFVNLNSSDPDAIANTSRPINGSELANETQTPFIKVNLQTGEITGHEGRHRMQALANAGVDRIAVLVVDEGKEGRNNRNRIDALTVQGKKIIKLLN